MLLAELVIDVLFIAAAVMASAFPIAYLVLPWNSTPQGRAIMHFAIGMALLMNLTILFSVWMPSNYWTLWGLQFVALAYVAAAAGYRSFVLIRDIRTHFTPPTKPVIGTDLSGHPENTENPPSHLG